MNNGGGFPGRRIVIKQWLEEFGDLCTRDIYDLFLKNHPRQAPSMIQLGSILGRSKGIERIPGHLEEYITPARYRAARYAIWTLVSNEFEGGGN